MLARVSIVPPFSVRHFPFTHSWAPTLPPGEPPILMLVLVPELPVGADGFWVTVTSVPTPYSELSTSAWAFFTPEEAADTVITRPTPSARPSAITTDCFIRRRSSRPR